MSLEYSCFQADTLLIAKEIEKAIADCKKYDLTLHDIAGRSIAIDLDDGVAVNWEKFKSVLARL